MIIILHHRIHHTLIMNLSATVILLMAIEMAYEIHKENEVGLMLYILAYVSFNFMWYHPPPGTRVGHHLKFFVRG